MERDLNLIHARLLRKADRVELLLIVLLDDLTQHKFSLFCQEVLDILLDMEDGNLWNEDILPVDCGLLVKNEDLKLRCFLVHFLHHCREVIRFHDDQRPLFEDLEVDVLAIVRHLPVTRVEGLEVLKSQLLQISILIFIPNSISNFPIDFFFVYLLYL